MYDEIKISWHCSDVMCGVCHIYSDDDNVSWEMQMAREDRCSDRALKLTFHRTAYTQPPPPTSPVCLWKMPFFPLFFIHGLSLQKIGCDWLDTIQPDRMKKKILANEMHKALLLCQLVFDIPSVLLCHCKELSISPPCCTSLLRKFQSFRLLIYLLFG